MFVRLIDVLFLKDGAFIELERRPRFGAMLVLLLGSTGAVLVWYAMQLDPAWFAGAVLGPGSEGVAIDPRTLALASVASSVAGGLALLAINALYLHLLTQAMCPGHRFLEWFAFCVWTSTPQLFTTLLMAARLLVGDTSRLMPEDLQIASLDALFLELAPDSPWRGLAASVSLATAWQLLLMTAGFGAWTRRRLPVAALAVMLPWAVFYLGWGLLILVGHP